MERLRTMFGLAWVGVLVVVLYSGALVTVSAREHAAPITDGDARAFVASWIDLSEKNENFDRVMDLYADEINFYKHGRVKKNVVADDKRKYFDRWSKRTYAVTSIAIFPGEGEGERKADVAFHYRIQNAAGRVLEGDARTALALRKAGNRVLIFGESDAAQQTTREEYLVWTAPTEQKKGVPSASETLWIDKSGTVLKRSKGKDLVAIFGDAVYTIRIEKRKVTMADCMSADRTDPEAKPPQVDALEPELALLKTAADGKESRSVIIPAEGDEYSERSTSINVLGTAGPWLFVVPSTFYYGCGAAHGGVGFSMIVFNVHTGETALIYPGQKTQGKKAGQKEEKPNQSLFTQKEHETVMKALGVKAIQAIKDEMIDMPSALDLTKAQPVIRSNALGLEVLLTGDTCYACSDGLWNSYTRSAALDAPGLPSMLQPYRNVPPAVLKWLARNKGAGYPTWSVIPSDAPLRKRIEMMFH